MVAENPYNLAVEKGNINPNISPKQLLEVYRRKSETSCFQGARFNLGLGADLEFVVEGDMLVQNDIKELVVENSELGLVTLRKDDKRNEEECPDVVLTVRKLDRGIFLGAIKKEGLISSPYGYAWSNAKFDLTYNECSRLLREAGIN